MNWEEIDRLKRQLARDEARARETELDPAKTGSVLAELSVYGQHSTGCASVTPEARARFRLTGKIECTCGWVDARARGFEWLQRHTPDLWRMITGVSPGDA